MTFAGIGTKNMNLTRGKHLLQYLFEIKLQHWIPLELKILKRHFLSVLIRNELKEHSEIAQGWGVSKRGMAENVRGLQ